MAWDDSDDEVLDVKASWDDDEEDEKEEEEELVKKVEVVSIQAPKKKTLTQKIAERNLADTKKEEQLETMHDRRAREKAEIEFESLKNAQELFGVSENVGASEHLFYSSKPRTKADFDVYMKHVMAQLATFEIQSQFPYFVETLTRELCNSLTLEDTRKISTVISAQINDKQKAFSNKKTKKAPAKKAQLSKSSAPDTENVDQYAGDYDDFM